MDLDPRPRPAVPTALTDYVDQQFALFRDNWDHLDLTGGREDPYIEAATDASIAIEEHLDFLQSTEPAEHLAAADRYRQALFQWHNDFTCVRTIAAEKTKTPIRTRSQEQLDASFRSAKAVVEEAEARMRLTRQRVDEAIKESEASQSALRATTFGPIGSHKSTDDWRSKPTPSARYDSRLSDEENAARKSAYREYKWSDKYYAQRCRDNRNVMSGMWKVLGCIALGCIAFGAAIGAAPGGFILAVLPLLFGLFITLLCAIFPEDWTGIF